MFLMRITCLNGSPEDPNKQQDLDEGHVLYENDHHENMFSMKDRHILGMDGSDVDDTSRELSKMFSTKDLNEGSPWMDGGLPCSE